MTLSLPESRTLEPGYTDRLHLHMPPAFLAGILREMETDEAVYLRNRLAEQAETEHAATIKEVAVEGRPSLIYAASVWPSVVGQETVAMFSLRRRQHALDLAPHPTDPLYHIMYSRVPRK